MVHIAAAGYQGDRLLAGVDQIPVDLVVARRRPDAENAVLAVQNDLTIGRQKIGNQGRQPDPKVDVGAVGEILRGPPGNLATFERHLTPPYLYTGTWTTRSTKMPGVITISGSSSPSSTIWRTWATERSEASQTVFGPHPPHLLIGRKFATGSGSF